MTMLPNPFEGMMAPPKIKAKRCRARRWRFVLDEREFMAAIEAPPAFLEAPRKEYLQALPDF
jgi:hypothetical protein